MPVHMHTYLFLFCNPCIPVSGSSSSVSLSIMKAAYAAEAPPVFGGCFRFTLEHASKNMYMQLNIRTFVYSLSLSLYLYLPLPPSLSLLTREHVHEHVLHIGTHPNDYQTSIQAHLYTCPSICAHTCSSFASLALPLVDSPRRCRFPARRPDRQRKFLRVSAAVFVSLWSMQAQ